ncbi:MAG TPA: sigma-70 family RNA polymerase sigma factor [Bryobacteraceae bacterium]|nr:sigma-70 family RNA polymerase sigma factor [Bryobacteraceae bacterium]
MWAQPVDHSGTSSQAPKSDDEALMVRVQAGDEAALGQLLDRHARLVLGIGFRILRDIGEAQELVQDVFLHAFRKCQLFDPRRGTVRGWLIRITCHRALNRREYLNLRRFYDHRNLDDFADVFQTAVDLEYEVQLSRSEEALRNAFAELNESQRTTLQLYFFEGYSLREISQRLGESLVNVRHHYYRALSRLKASAELNSLKDE